MADIRKRQGKKGVTYQVRYPNKSVKSGYSFATFKTMKEARAFTENLAAVRSKTKSAVSSVQEAVDIWLNTCEKIGRDGREKVEPETLKEYQRRANVIKEYYWEMPLADIRSADVAQFRNWLLHNKSRDLSRRCLSSFHSVLIEMKTQGHIDDDPATGITIRNDGRYEDQGIEIPSDAEMRKLLEAADAMGAKNDFMGDCWARYRPMIYLAVFSGMRPSEYRGLPWENIGSDHVKVTQRADKTGIIGPVKSKAAKRTIYVPQFVIEMIRDWKTSCPASPHNLVFPTGSGNAIRPNNFRASAWIPLLKEAGLMVSEKSGEKIIQRPKYTQYALRHYFASKLIEKDRDTKYIQEMMGHSKIEITYNVYGHLLKDREKEYRNVAEEFALELLGKKPCGNFVASTL
jgi:integrase